MNASETWRRIWSGEHGNAVARDANLRRVGLRLAVQTVGLLLVMLIVLELVVYLKTQYALLDTLDGTLKDRATPGPGGVHAILHPGDGDTHGFQNGFQHPSFAPPHDTRASDASVTYLNLGLKKIGPGAGPQGNIVYDLSAARSALTSGRPYCCTTRTFGDRDYRIYTGVLNEDGMIVGVAQSSISIDQYESTLSGLRETLLIVALLGLLISGAISAALVQRALLPVRVAMQRQRDFVADAAHELRTPLAIMRSVGELGVAESSPDDQQATIEQMLAQNSHLTRLVDDLSLLARADSNAVTMQQSSIDLSSLVSGVTEEIKPLAEEQGVDLVTVADGNITVFGDIVRLRQLLLILLDNALKHTPAGRAVQVNLHQRSGRATLRVADSGPGIDPHDLPHIFDRFYRADKARTGEGSGLGLAIGRWIVQAHGGTIQAGNGAEQGAIFTVSLPIMRGTSPAPDPARPAQQHIS